MADREIGHALLLVNENFTDKHFSRREGAEWDLINMYALFRALKFKTIAFKDQTKAGMMKKLKMFVGEICQDDSIQNSAVIISSHGKECYDETQEAQNHQVVRLRQSVYGTDGLNLMLDDIFQLFERPELKEKQKWFFIQACRSRTFGSRDPGVCIAVLTAPGSDVLQSGNWTARNNALRACVNEMQPGGKQRKPEEWWDKGQEPETGTTARTLQSERGPAGPRTDVFPQISSTVQPFDEVLISDLPDNTLVVSSATAGQVSYRDTRVGSLMYHFMYRNAVTLLREGNILRYLTVVAGEIAGLDIEMDNEHYKACLALQHTLCQRADFKASRHLLDKLKEQGTN